MITNKPSPAARKSPADLFTRSNIDEEYDYVEKDNINEDLICSICKQPFVNPVSHSSCGNTFCFKCVGKVENCPMCGEDDFFSKCSPSVKTIKNMLDKLKVKCSICKTVVMRGELKNHKEKHNQVTPKRKFGDYNGLNEDNLKKQKKDVALVDDSFENINKPIHLNVGGTIMTVSLGTFTLNEREPDNLFKKMFNGEYPLYETPSKMFDDPIYFIDCDPIIFKHIIDWLKFGLMASNLEVDTKKSLLQSCQMFQLTNISDVLTKEFNTIATCQISQFDFITLLQKKPINLNGMDLRKLSLNCYNLINSSIIGADFSGMNLKGTNFKGSNFKGSNFSNSLLNSINFEGCDLSDCNFSNTIVERCNFYESIFENIDFIFIESNLETNNLIKNCLIKNSDLKELKDLSKFKGFKFDSCLFNFNQFTNKQIENVKFENISFENIDFNFNELQFKNVEFINCKGVIIESSIIDYNNNISSTIFKETKSKLKPELLYRGSRDGFKAENFHSKCDNQGATLTIIKSEYDQIFGGFTSLSWKSPENEKRVSDDFAFIFKILNCENGNYQFKKFNITQDDKDKAIYLYKDYLSIFGGGHDFYICNDCNLYNNSYSNFGSSYELPNELKFRSNEAQSYLAGSEFFKVKEIEVFKIYQ